MHPTLAGHLAPLRSHLVPRLCSEDDLGALLEVAAGLPAVPAGGFERSLGRGAAGLDLSICVRNAQPAARALLEGGYGGAAVNALLAAVRDPESPLHGALDVFWLEYDVSRGGRAPSLFAGPRGEDRGRTVLRATELVRGERPAPSVVRTFARLSVPIAGVQLFQAGWMLARARPGLRLCFVAHTLPSLLRLLEHAVAPEARAVLRERCERYGRLVDELVLAVDIGDGEVGPRVGLELGFRGPKQQVRLERWGELLLALEHDGLCTAEQRAALLRWPGRMAEGGDGAQLPRLLRGSRALLGPYAPRVDRVLHHVKLVVDHEELVASKAYFGILQGWAVA